jgi:hypothetical protein
MATEKKSNAAATASDRPSKTRPKRMITENDIARRAYDFYLARGREHGHDVEDWLQAEHELSGEALS